MGKLTERVKLRVIACPDCNNIRCHINERLPNYCCECGAFVHTRIRGRILATDQNALLSYDMLEVPNGLV